MEQVPGPPPDGRVLPYSYVYRFEEGSPMRCRSACPSPWQPWRQRLSVKGLNRRYCPKFFNRISGPLQASAGYILSQMLDR